MQLLQREKYWVKLNKVALLKYVLWKDFFKPFYCMQSALDNVYLASHIVDTSRTRKYDHVTFHMSRAQPSLKQHSQGQMIARKCLKLFYLLMCFWLTNRSLLVIIYVPSPKLGSYIHPLQNVAFKCQMVAYTFQGISLSYGSIEFCSGSVKPHTSAGFLK